MDISIEALTEKYKDQLYEYECENREYYKKVKWVIELAKSFRKKGMLR